MWLSVISTNPCCRFYITIAWKFIFNDMRTTVSISIFYMQVGESRAASLGHTSGISWVEGDAQVKPRVIFSPHVTGVYFTQKSQFFTPLAFLGLKEMHR